MSFMQKFKGKTHTISKQSIGEILGSKKNVRINGIEPDSPTIQIPILRKSPSTHARISVQNPQIRPIVHRKIMSQAGYHSLSSSKPSDSPYFVIPYTQNAPQQIRHRPLPQTTSQLPLKISQSLHNSPLRIQPKFTTKTASMGDGSSYSSRNIRQWTRLGGLGPNIGGQQWIEKKRKMQRMQEFSAQIKNLIANKASIPTSVGMSERNLETGSRFKGFQYSKRIDKTLHRESQAFYPQKLELEVQRKNSLNQIEDRHLRIREMLRKIQN